MDEARRQQVLPGSRISSFRQPGEAAAAVLSGSSGPELRTPLLLALLAVLLVEPLLANRAALRRARRDAAETPKRRMP
jgi:hypothetical protein